MSHGPLRFRTPHIEELPTTQSRRAPGFAYVAVSGHAPDDPSKNWGTSNRKRARTQGGQTDAQKEAQSARRQRDIEKKIRDLNNDNSKDVQIPLPKNPNAARSGKTTQTKKILNSGKNFAHYLDDEEAEIARTGRRDGDAEVMPAVNSSSTMTTNARPSKTPIARRKARTQGSVSGSPAPPAMRMPPPPPVDVMEIDPDDVGEDSTVPRLPTTAEMEALLNAPSLSFNQARSAPPPPGAPPPRQFCETCGYWGRVKCSKCGIMTCSVICKATHDEYKCLKIYA
nr:swr1 complex subunit vps71 [Quercus suber]